jgi:uncharacterized DUF497 family protein
LRFEWNDQKALDNVVRHGVTFGEATDVFYDPYAVEVYDSDHSSYESRFAIIEYSTARMLYVVYAERVNNVIRIISARPPTPAERKLYEEKER